MLTYLFAWFETGLCKIKRSGPLSSRSESGQGLVEYALILVLVAILVIIILALAGDVIRAWFLVPWACIRFGQPGCEYANGLMASGQYKLLITWATGPNPTLP